MHLVASSIGCQSWELIGYLSVTFSGAPVSNVDDSLDGANFEIGQQCHTCRPLDAINHNVPHVSNSTYTKETHFDQSYLLIYFNHTKSFARMMTAVTLGSFRSGD